MLRTVVVTIWATMANVSHHVRPSVVDVTTILCVKTHVLRVKHWYVIPTHTRVKRQAQVHRLAQVQKVHRLALLPHAIPVK